MEIQRNMMNVHDRKIVQNIYVSYEIFILTYLNLIAFRHIWDSSQRHTWTNYSILDMIICLWDTKKNELFYHYFTNYLFTEMALLTFFPFVLKNSNEWKIINLFWIGVFFILQYLSKNNEVMGFMMLIYTIDKDFYLKMLAKKIYPFKWVLPIYHICLLSFYIFLFVLFSIEGVKWIQNSI